MTGGYSATPQARKLGLKPGSRCLLDDPPAGWAFEDPPDLVTPADGEAVDVVIAFVRESRDIVDRVERLAPLIRPAGALWVAWPRRAAGHRSDVTESAIREAALARGLVDVKVAAIDTDWSGLKIVWRRENR